MSDSNHASDANNNQNVEDMISEETMLVFSEDEESLIARVFRLVGQRWSLIAGRIPGRTAEEIEKYWTSKCASSSDQQTSFARELHA